MSFRALRKAQREKEEQDRLAQLEREAEELEEEDHAPVVRKSAFAMLEEEDEDEPEDEEPADDEDKEEAVEESLPKPSSGKKKKKKRKKTKAKPGEDAVEEEAKDEEELDEIDAALRALSTKNGAELQDAQVADTQSVSNETHRLLAIDTTHLHAQNEMRRLFGRTALEQEADEQAPPAAVGGNRRQQRRVMQVGLAQALRGQRQDGGRAGGLSAMALRRNIFIQGKEEWPVATGGGLGMEVEEKRADGTILYRYVHNSSYRDVQAQFDLCVAAMDPQRMVVLLQHNPYHISTLLQVSEIAKQERDHATSGDLLERALFSLGRAVHSTFAKNLAEGKARLDFRRAENREFWLASWRYMQNLTMRGTWRTVYEWAKLLLSLSPEDDPYALWLLVDQYALRARQDNPFLSLSSSDLNTAHTSAEQSLPNIAFSRALAEFRSGDARKGRQALFTSIGRYPWVVARLLHELNLDAPPGVWGKEPRTEREKLHSELYASRAKDLWNIPEYSNLLVETASALVDGSIPPAALDETPISLAEARQVILSDRPELISLVPRKYTQMLTTASDPLPPEDALDSYLSSSRETTSARPSAAVMSTNGNARLHGMLTELLRLQQELLARGGGGGGSGTATGENNADAAQETQPGESLLMRAMPILRRFLPAAMAGGGSEQAGEEGHDGEGQEDTDPATLERELALILADAQTQVDELPPNRRARVEDAEEEEDEE